MSSTPPLPGPPLPDARAGRESARLVADRGGGLGRLAGIAGWVAGVQGAVPPRPFRRVRAVLVTAPSDEDPRGADSGSADQIPVLDALATGAGVTRRLVEVASVGNRGDNGARRLPGTLPGLTLPELTPAEFAAAHELGRFVADEEADSGTDLLIIGAGSGTREADITAATALVAALLGREPVAMIGTDTGAGSAAGLDDRAWTQRVKATRDALRRTRTTPAPDDGDLLRLLGGGRIAVLVGLLQQATIRRTPVLLDGTVTCAAALAAERLNPGSRHWWSAPTTSPEPAAGAALVELRLRPLLDLGIRTGDGTAALLALPLLEAAIDAAGALAGGALADGSGG